MDFLDLVQSRYSLRNYSPQSIAKEILEQIIHVAHLAPSAVNYQPWSFLVVTQSATMSKIYESYNRDWFKTVHTCIIVLGDHSQSWKRKDGKDFCDVDVAIAIDHLTLAATANGLGTCWVCNFDNPKLSEILELPVHIEPIAIIPIGYPADGIQIPEKKRKNLNEIVRWIE